MHTHTHTHGEEGVKLRCDHKIRGFAVRDGITEAINSICVRKKCIIISIYGAD